MKTKTTGETLFEEYLKARGLTFRYEDPDIESRKKPDYLVFSDPKVVCEVEDLCGNDADKHAAGPLARGEAVVEWSDSTTRAREKIIKGAKQLRDHKGTHPCVVVLHNTSATGVHPLAGTEAIVRATYKFLEAHPEVRAKRSGCESSTIRSHGSPSPGTSSRGRTTSTSPERLGTVRFGSGPEAPHGLTGELCVRSHRTAGRREVR
jgi:hypothetical protein